MIFEDISFTLFLYVCPAQIASFQDFLLQGIWSWNVRSLRFTFFTCIRSNIIRLFDCSRHLYFGDIFLIDIDLCRGWLSRRIQALGNRWSFLIEKCSDRVVVGLLFLHKNDLFHVNYFKINNFATYLMKELILINYKPSMNDNINIVKLAIKFVEFISIIWKEFLALWSNSRLSACKLPWSLLNYRSIFPSQTLQY